MTKKEINDMVDKADRVQNVKTQNDVPLKGLNQLMAFKAVSHNGFYAYTEKSTGDKVLLTADF